MHLYYWTDDDPIHRPVPVPTDLNWELNDVDKNSGRNDNGDMMREVVGKKLKLSLKWSIVEGTESFKIFYRWAKNLPPFFYMEWLDPGDEIVTFECYSSKISGSELYEGNDMRVWQDVSFNATGR